MQNKLERLLNPKTVAIVGASKKEERLGYTLLKNMVNADFHGMLYPVNPKYSSISGIQCYPDIRKVAEAIDLAIVTVPEHRIQEVIEACCEKKVGGLLVMSGGSMHEKQKDTHEKIISTCQQHKIPLLGIDSFGFLRPPIHLNASLARRLARKGGIAFISQSKSISSSVLEWAEWKHIGFSSFISVGQMLDVNLHHLIDYLGNDPYTRSILLFMESLTEVRRFLSAARAFSRNKPIIVLKAGKSSEGAAIIRQHTDWEPGDFKAYQAAFERAGIIQVETINQLFDAAEALASQPRPGGNRLAIISNGGGPGILATDYLVRQGGSLPDYDEKTFQTLMEKTSPRSFRSGLIDLDNTASPELFRIAVEACMKDKSTDGVLAILSSQVEIQASEFAKALSNVKTNTSKPLLISWIGYGTTEESLDQFRKFQLPVYRFPESAVDTFLRMAAYSQNIKALYETPKALPYDFRPEREKIQQFRQGIKNRKGKDLSRKEIIDLLSLYDIPVAEGFSTKLTELGPEEPSGSWELSLSSQRDALFGPILSIGTGGKQAALFPERGYGIPPLNMGLASRIIQKSPLSRLPEAGHSSNSPDLEALAFLLCKLSLLTMDMPEIEVLSIPSLLMRADEVKACRAMVRLGNHPVSEDKRYNHLVISPYPDEYIKGVVLPGGQKVTLRPIKPEDEELERVMIGKFSRQSLYYRFFGYVNHFSHDMISRFTHNDYDREIAIIAEVREEDRTEMIGVVRLVADADNENAEYAIAIPDPWQGKGLGSTLTDYILAIARKRGIQKVFANVLIDNEGMIQIFKKRGFRFVQEDYKTYYVELTLA
jgi:acetyltransferase